MDNADAYEANISPWRTILLLLASIGFVVAGLWMAGLFGEPPLSRRWSPELVSLIGWVAVVFFAAAGVLIARRLLRKGPAFRIDAQGIWNPDLSPEIFAWEEITDFGEVRVMNNSFLGFNITPERASRVGGFQRTMGKLNRGTGNYAFTIPVTGTDADLDEMVAAARRFAPSEPVVMTRRND